MFFLNRVLSGLIMCTAHAYIIINVYAGLVSLIDILLMRYDDFSSRIRCRLAKSWLFQSVALKKICYKIKAKATTTQHELFIRKISQIQNRTVCFIKREIKGRLWRTNRQYVCYRKWRGDAVQRSSFRGSDGSRARRAPRLRVLDSFRKLLYHISWTMSFSFIIIYLLSALVLINKAE